jgi:hypothetical protein
MSTGNRKAGNRPDWSAVLCILREAVVSADTGITRANIQSHA